MDRRVFCQKNRLPHNIEMTKIEKMMKIKKTENNFSVFISPFY